MPRPDHIPWHVERRFGPQGRARPDNPAGTAGRQPRHQFVGGELDQDGEEASTRIAPCGRCDHRRRVWRQRRDHRAGEHRSRERRARPSRHRAPPSRPSGEAAAPLAGEITLWHSYGSGGGETGAFQKALGAILTANPDLKVNVVEQPFSDIFTKWTTDVGAGGGPDMFVAPNDSLFAQSDAGVLADLTTALEGKLEGFSQVAVDGSKVDGKFFMVPESLKAVALWYDKSQGRHAPGHDRRAPRGRQGRLDQARPPPGHLPQLRLDRLRSAAR